MNTDTITTMIPHCDKCANRILQPDILDPTFDSVVGCKKLSKKEWDKGFRRGGTDLKCQLKFQHNCPLIVNAKNQRQRP